MKITLKNALEMITELQNRIESLESQSYSKRKPSRDRGPKSTRKMTEADARNILMGKLKNLSHKEAAKKLKLSYAQIYSCRGGYTFKNLQDEMRKSK